MTRWNRKILLVDNDNDYRVVLALALELEGFTVLQAAGGDKALEILSGECPDLIISDLEMRGIDGRALCGYVRGNGDLSDIPFVILSAFVDPNEPGNLGDLPADCFVSKQVPVAHLVEIIRDLLSGVYQRTHSGRIQVIE